MRSTFLLVASLLGALAVPVDVVTADEEADFYRGDYDAHPKELKPVYEGIVRRRGLSKNLNCTFNDHYFVSDCILLDDVTNTFDRLALRVHMYDRNTSGTPEKIYGTFSPDTGFHASNPQVHMLFDAPVPGAAKVVEIDMEKQFGVKVAPISSISQYQILQAIHTDVLLDENRYEIEAFVFEIHHVQSNTILRNEVEAPCFDCLKKLPSKKVLDSETINGVLYPVWKHPLELKEWTVRERLYPGTMHTSGPCLPKTFNQRKCDRDPIYHGYPPVLAVA